jgi:hypothetical protein
MILVPLSSSAPFVRFSILLFHRFPLDLPSHRKVIRHAGQDGLGHF